MRPPQQRGPSRFASSACHSPSCPEGGGHRSVALVGPRSDSCPSARGTETAARRGRCGSKCRPLSIYCAWGPSRSSRCRREQSYFQRGQTNEYPPSSLFRNHHKKSLRIVQAAASLGPAKSVQNKSWKNQRHRTMEPPSWMTTRQRSPREYESQLLSAPTAAKGCSGLCAQTACNPHPPTSLRSRRRCSEKKSPSTRQAWL
mmetsp:Transcript_18192/g.50634  ORF Transcript_18192/g.50634 Transcript_18192/m.50634 type:complete len:201 (+) Transcript_18192:604-1206(+)